MEVFCMTRNPQALALAFKKCRGKILKIQDLGITPDMDKETVEEIIETLANAKALEDGAKMSDHVKGQRWYVENLVKFSALSVEEQVELEYQDSFADTASENEMLKALKALAA